MVPHLYRFRSTRSLLDGFHELEKQEIYFSPPDQLNDPMEGYKDVVWCGDAIVWRNLLRHYALCLLQSTYLFFVMGSEFDTKYIQNVIGNMPGDLPDAPIRDIYQIVSINFLSENGVVAFVEAISTHPYPVRRHEVTYHLRNLHPLALLIIMNEIARRGLIRRNGSGNCPINFASLEQHARHLQKNIANKLINIPYQNDKREEFFASLELMNLQVQLISDINDSSNLSIRHWNFLFRDFPSIYASSTDILIHQPWFTACFAADPTDASMWGTYGDGHRGVCLKFNTGSDNTDTPGLNLYGFNGWSGNKERITMSHSFSWNSFHEIKYSKTYPEIDFFRSIGRVASKHLTEFWYRGDSGEISLCASDVYTDKTAWREKYWKTFYDGITCKTPEWSHEKEYRLILSSNLYDFSDINSRKLVYKFPSLSGIIFGDKTRNSDKKDIIQIIRQKCVRELRTDFQFLTIQYVRSEHKFRVIHLDLL
jgi:hypothetical protein